MTKIKNKIKEFVSEAKEAVVELVNDEDTMKDCAIQVMIPFAICGFVITVAYWFGHPEMVLKKRCTEMIVKNVLKKRGESF